MSDSEPDCEVFINSCEPMGQAHREHCYLVWEVFRDRRIRLRGVGFALVRTEIMRDNIMRESGFSDHVVVIEKRDMDHLFRDENRRMIIAAGVLRMKEPLRGKSHCPDCSQQIPHHQSNCKYASQVHSLTCKRCGFLNKTDSKVSV